MATSPSTLDLANSQLRLYEERTESSVEGWKKDHHEAMRCFQFEEHLAFGVLVFNLINRIDEAWHRKVFKKQLPYDEELDEAIHRLFVAWVKPCPILIRALDRFEKKGFAVTGGEEFRSCCREAAGVLTADEKFFVGDDLAKLCDAAIDAHRRGETAEMKEFGD